MLRALVSPLPLVRDAFVRTLSLEKLEESPIATVYRLREWMFIFLHVELSSDVTHWLAATYLPERVYFPVFGYSIDMVHEVGDVIVPNVFFQYEKSVADTDITKDNRDSLVEMPRFLEIFDEQKDYYVEDYGLSVGGIVVDSAPASPSDDLMGKMMLAYEWDVYIEPSLVSAYDAVIEEQTPSVILVGIMQGKAHQKYADATPLDLAAKNIVTTIRLMEEE